jgi:hypothetical protein
MESHLPLLLLGCYYKAIFSKKPQEIIFIVGVCSQRIVWLDMLAVIVVSVKLFSLKKKS